MTCSSLVIPMMAAILTPSEVIVNVDVNCLVPETEANSVTAVTTWRKFGVSDYRDLMQLSMILVVDDIVHSRPMYLISRFEEIVVIRHACPPCPIGSLVNSC